MILFKKILALCLLISVLSFTAEASEIEEKNVYCIDFCADIFISSSGQKFSKKRLE